MGRQKEKPTEKTETKGDRNHFASTPPAFASRLGRGILAKKDKEAAVFGYIFIFNIAASIQGI